MNKMKVGYLINTVISGTMAFLISTFFAQGTIAENYTDKTWVAPEFLWILPIWGLGFLIGLFVYRSKSPGIYFFVSVLVTWASIPAGIRLGFYLAT
ncbi:hypothetical protein [Salimicrobium halophilum]|uniref:Uncharacterized protein n=1 Tax=Salimicrobium halophilum TaxID=86666 RepID=A0A1G8QY92_9BACI|nr:hypothetical protein [Salimicrobium halophilum]SDJ09285.1 hypothetical protein SAMN04490247_0685 [Salimicrobium halophilum]